MAKQIELPFGEDPLPGGPSNIIGRRTSDNPFVEMAREHTQIAPADYVLDNYELKVEKEKSGDVIIKISGKTSEGGRIGTGFRLAPNTPYNIAASHMRAAFNAIFKHRANQILKKQDDN